MQKKTKDYFSHQAVIIMKHIDIRGAIERFMKNVVTTKSLLTKAVLMREISKNKYLDRN